jgi:hypothetical protein
LATLRNIARGLFAVNVYITAQVVDFISLSGIIPTCTTGCVFILHGAYGVMVSTMASANIHKASSLP